MKAVVIAWAVSGLLWIDKQDAGFWVGLGLYLLATLTTLLVIAGIGYAAIGQSD